jgi:Tfp pilus tip-associated adhesin PilY1
MSWLKDTTYQSGTLHYKVFNGKHVAYHDKTEFLIQVGKGKKGSYRTKTTIVGNLARAVFWYDGINLGPGWKKRILMPSCSHNPVLHRATFSGLP